MQETPEATRERINAEADRRITLMQENRDIQVNAQIEALRVAASVGAPLETLLSVARIMLADNLIQR